jgi:hypothetical protein
VARRGFRERTRRQIDSLLINTSLIDAAVFPSRTILLGSPPGVGRGRREFEQIRRPAVEAGLMSGMSDRTGNEMRIVWITMVWLRTASRDIRGLWSIHSAAQTFRIADRRPRRRNGPITDSALTVTLL